MSAPLTLLYLAVPQHAEEDLAAQADLFMGTLELSHSGIHGRLAPIGQPRGLRRIPEVSAPSDIIICRWVSGAVREAGSSGPAADPISGARWRQPAGISPHRRAVLPELSAKEVDDDVWVCL